MHWSAALTDDMKVFLQVKEGDATGMKTLPGQFELQFLL